MSPPKDVFNFPFFDDFTEPQTIKIQGKKMFSKRTKNHKTKTSMVQSVAGPEHQQKQFDKLKHKFAKDPFMMEVLSAMSGSFEMDDNIDRNARQNYMKSNSSPSQTANNAFNNDRVFSIDENDVCGKGKVFDNPDDKSMKKKKRKKKKKNKTRDENPEVARFQFTPIGQLSAEFVGRQSSRAIESRNKYEYFELNEKYLVEFCDTNSENSYARKRVNSIVNKISQAVEEKSIGSKVINFLKELTMFQERAKKNVKPQKYYKHKRYVLGISETMTYLKRQKGEIKVVIIAKDIEEHVFPLVNELKQNCRATDVPIVMELSRSQIKRSCSSSMRHSCVGILSTNGCEKRFGEIVESLQKRKQFNESKSKEKRINMNKKKEKEK